MRHGVALWRKIAYVSVIDAFLAYDIQWSYCGEIKGIQTFVIVKKQLYQIIYIKLILANLTASEYCPANLIFCVPFVTLQ